MNPESLRDPLLLGDPRQLERKLAASSGLLREYWDDFQRAFLRDPKIRPQVLFLPACLTVEGLEEARQLLRAFWRNLPQLDTSDAVQYHTWWTAGDVPDNQLQTNRLHPVTRYSATGAAQ